MEKDSTSTKEIESSDDSPLVAHPPRLPPSTSQSTPSKPQPRTRPTISSRMKEKLAKPFRKPETKFTLFPYLPTELRLKIWEASIEARVHELHPCANLYHNRMTFRSNAATTPSIFHADRESREVARKHYKLMEYTPSEPNEDEVTATTKGILRFYYAPKHDTLLLNSLMGLFVMFMLLEESTLEPEDILSVGGITAGVMAGWERVAIDAERAQLITLLSGAEGRSSQPRFKKLIPDLKELVIAFDYTRSGKTRFRTSVWPGENGTSLRALRTPKGYEGDWNGILDGCLSPLRGFLKIDYMSGVVDKPQAVDERDVVEVNENDVVPTVSAARVERKKYIRGDLRYAFRWSCSIIGVRPRGVFRRL